MDEDRDGVADISELDSTQVVARRLMVLTKSVDPEKVSAAVEGLTLATVAILATLRIRFAKAITLGTAIGSAFEKLFSPFTTQILRFSLPDAYEKWIPVRRHSPLYFDRSLKVPRNVFSNCSCGSLSDASRHMCLRKKPCR